MAMMRSETNKMEEEKTTVTSEAMRKEKAETAECYGPLRSPGTSARGRSPPFKRMNDEQEEEKKALPDVAGEKKRRSELLEVAASSNSQMQTDEE